MIGNDVGVVCDGGGAEIVIRIRGMETTCAEDECEYQFFHMGESIND